MSEQSPATNTPAANLREEHCLGDPDCGTKRGHSLACNAHLMVRFSMRGRIQALAEEWATRHADGTFEKEVAELLALLDDPFAPPTARPSPETHDA